MNKPLIYTPIACESNEEREMLQRNIVASKVRRIAGQARSFPNKAIVIEHPLGQFEATYHTFEDALEIINAERTFRFVFGNGFTRIDGDKAALKLWLMINKLTN
ncbi:hypothetical protein [Rhizobium sp.]|uniref:hypothetical protein n=1 Tax=Rhizobium sp. TaxID=391 RepID=UPI0034C6DC2E